MVKELQRWERSVPYRHTGYNSAMEESWGIYHQAGGQNRAQLSIGIKINRMWGYVQWLRTYEIIWMYGMQISITYKEQFLFHAGSQHIDKSGSKSHVMSINRKIAAPDSNSDSHWLTIKCSMLSLVRLELLSLSMASLRASSCSVSLRRRQLISSLRDCS